MTDKMAIRTFPTAFKLKAIKRAEGGEGVLPVARKLDRLLVDTDLNNRHICR